MAFHCLPDEIQPSHTDLYQRDNEMLLDAQAVVTIVSTITPFEATIVHPSAQEKCFWFTVATSCRTPTTMLMVSTQLLCSGYR